MELKPRSLFVLFVLAAVAFPASASAAINATASVDTTDTYITKAGAAGETYTFTVTNPAGSDNLGSVKITKPAGAWTITAAGCATGRANWTGTSDGTSCTFTSTANPIGASASQTFSVVATTTAGSNDVPDDAWDVEARTPTTWGNPNTDLDPTVGGTLAGRAWNFEIEDAVITTSAATVGAACPAANKTAPTVSSRVVVVCGRQWGAGVLGTRTPVSGQSSLAGTMIGTAGVFASGAISHGSLTPGPVVLANYTNTTIHSTAGTGKTVITTIGATNQKSPSTTLTGYEATLSPTTVTNVSGSGTYGGTATLTATLNSTSPATGFVSGKSIAFTLNGNSVGSATTNASGVATLTGVSLAGKDAGPEAGVVGATFDATSDPTYTGSSGSGDLNVGQKTLHGSFTAPDKPYDGNTTSAITRSVTQAEVVGSDEVFLDPTAGGATFADANVARAPNGTVIDKVVTGSGFALGGADAANYSLTMSNTTDNAKINPKNLGGSFVADDKIYDGETDATFTPSLNAADIVSGDAAGLTLGGSQSADFADESVARDVNGDVIDQVVTGTGFVLSGAKAGNYTLVMDLTDDAKITPKNIDGSFTANDKPYDGTTDATFTADLDDNDIVQGDANGLGLGGTQSADFADESVARDVNGDVIDQVVTGQGFALTGAKAGNYTLVMDLTDDAKITPRPVDGSFTADDKVYDGTAAATISGSSLDAADIVSGDESGLALGGTQTASFADANVSRAPNGNVLDKVVTGAGFVLTGANINNYELVMDLTDDAKITPVGLNGSFTTEDKVYDGSTTAAVLTRTLDPTGIVSGDEPDVVIDANAGGADFASPDVARDVDGNVIDQVVTTSGFQLDGAKADNYDLTMGTQMAKITPKSVGGSFTADDKVYDGTTAAIINGSLLAPADIVGTDDVGISHASATATFANRNVSYDVDGVTPIDKVVTGAGFVLTGTTAGNYSLNMDATDDAKISPRPIGDATFTAANKQYDGTTAATVTGSSFTDDVPGDAVSLTGTPTFADKEVGNDKVVTLASPALGGADAGNYTLGTVDDTTTANITRRPLTGSFTAADKVYDGGTGATVTGRSVSGKVGNEDVSLVGGTASFGSEAAGDDKNVTLAGASLGGADEGNYTLGSISATTADITKKSVTGSFTAADKDFDGTKNATITGRSLSGAVAGDSVSLSGGVAGFVTPGPGVDITVLGFSFTLAGADAGNYTLSSVDPTTATIRQRGPGEQENPPSEKNLEQAASDKLGGDVKPTGGLDFGDLASAFSPQDQGKAINATNQALFGIGCAAPCSVKAGKTLVLTGDAGASAAATKKVKLKTQKVTLATGEIGVVKLKLTKKQKKAIKKAKRAKLIVKVTITSGGETVTDKKTYRLKVAKKG